MPQVKVVVTLKPTLLDAQGRVIQVDVLHGYSSSRKAMPIASSH